MAKASKMGSPSRIRFVMVEAELAEGHIGQITLAIQNALRGPATVQRIAPPVAAKNIAPEPHEFNDELENEEKDETLDVTPEVARQRAPRRPAQTPKVISIDLDSDPSLASFAEKFKPNSHHTRYLIIAAWLHEHRSIDAITADHVYTCYRSLEWHCNVNDFAQPLRELKHKQLFGSPARGKYTINHLGLARVAKLGAGGK